MKILLHSLLLLTTISISAQVGINNIDPQETLHVTGTVRIETTDQATVTTDKIFGLDGDGTLREIAVGSNLILQDNILYAKSANDHSFGSITLTQEDNDNVDLLLDPGEFNFGKSIIRVFNTEDDTVIEGITDGYDGQHIWVYAQSGRLGFAANVSTIPANQIENNNKKGTDIWGIIELVYDGTRAKWIIMQHHRDS